MRSAPPDRRRTGRRPGWPVVLLAAALGVAAGATVPHVGETSAVYVDGASVAGSFDVRPCSFAWSAAVAALTTTRHVDFGSASVVPGDVPAPGLLACDPSGALALAGGTEENVQVPGGAMDQASVATLAFWASISDSATPGDLVWVTQADGYGLGLRVSGGMLQVVEAPAGGGPAAVLAQVAAPDSDPHLITLTRTGGTAVQLWLDVTAVASVALSPSGAGPLTLWLGAPTGSGSAAAHVVLDEVLVLPAALGAGGVAGLVAANTW